MKQEISERYRPDRCKACWLRSIGVQMKLLLVSMFLLIAGCSVNTINIVKENSPIELQIKDAGRVHWESKDSVWVSGYGEQHSFFIHVNSPDAAKAKLLANVTKRVHIVVKHGELEIKALGPGDAT
jgi:hypothetical protein